MCMYKCYFANDRITYNGKQGYCERKRCYCNGNGNLFVEGCDNDKVEKVDKKDICRKSNLFGNYYITLTDEQIEAIKNGDVFALLYQEYNIFIAREV